MLVFHFIYRSENSKFLIQNSQIALTRIHAPRKSMQRYYFFSTWPNNPRKKRDFSAFFHQKLSLSLFCHLDFTKFTLFFLHLLHPSNFLINTQVSTTYKPFQHPHFYLLKTLVFFTPIIPFFYLLLCLINYVSFT